MTKDKGDNIMWVFTQHGFISAVEHFDDSNTIVVRARDRKALDMISELHDLEIQRTPDNDYPYRVHAPRDKFVSYLLTEVDMLNYGNFKDRLHASRGDRYYIAASQVWSVMRGLEDPLARPDEVERI